MCARRLVEVGQRERGAEHLAVALGDPGPVLVEDRLQVLGVVAHLVLVQRHEAPVALPGRVVDLEEAADLGLEVALAHVPHRHAVLARDLLRRGLDHRVEAALAPRPCRAAAPTCRGPSPCSRPAALEQLPVVGVVPALEDQRLALVALDQQAALVVGGEVHRARPCGRGRARAASPRPRRAARRPPRVVLALEEAEQPPVVVLELVEVAVDVGADPAHRLAVAPGEEVLGLGVLEERVLARGPGTACRSRDERRDPVRLVTIEPPRQLDEARQVAPRGDRPDLDRSRAATLAQMPETRPPAQSRTTSSRRPATTSGAS